MRMRGLHLERGYPEQAHRGALVEVEMNDVDDDDVVKMARRSPRNNVKGWDGGKEKLVRFVKTKEQSHEHF